MTWTMLAVLAVVAVVVGLSRRGSGWSLDLRSSRHPEMGVEGVRRLRSETRAALDAATTLLR